MIKILSLWQPWGTLMALGYKRNETRSWATPYRGLIAIHAAKNKEAICDTGDLLVQAGIKKSLFDPDPFPTGDQDWNFGCILAVGRLTGCIHTHMANPSPQERALGNYTEGRAAWVFEEIRRVKPLPFRGMQGLKDLPADVEAKLEYVGL